MKKLVEKYPAIPYVLPFGVFVLLTGLIPYLPHNVMIGYPIKTLIVSILVIMCIPYSPKLKMGYIFSSIVIGLIVLVIWINDPDWYPKLGSITVFNPWKELSCSLAIVWISIRLFGASVLVPIIEEFFWRGFLLRWLIKEDFKSVELGTFTWQSFIISAILFGVEHHRWGVGIIAGIIYALLLYRTKSLFACIIAHAVTNLALGLYVITTNSWSFW